MFSCVSWLYKIGYSSRTCRHTDIRFVTRISLFANALSSMWIMRCRIQKLLILNWVRKQKPWTNLMWYYGNFLEELRETQSKFELETWMQNRKDATTTPRRVSWDRIKFHSKAIKVCSRKGEDCICMNYVLFCIGRISLSWYFLPCSTDAVSF